MNEQRTDSFIRKPEVVKIETLTKYALQNLQKLSAKDIKKYLDLDSVALKTGISKNEWVQILTSVSKYIVKHQTFSLKILKIN